MKKFNNTPSAQLCIILPNAVPLDAGRRVLAVQPVGCPDAVRAARPRQRLVAVVALDGVDDRVGAGGPLQARHGAGQGLRGGQAGSVGQFSLLFFFLHNQL